MRGAIPVSLGKAGWLPAGDDSREEILPTSQSPSVITTVAGHGVKGRISKLRVRERVPTSQRHLRKDDKCCGIPMIPEGEQPSVNHQVFPNQLMMLEMLSIF